jgi:hypothetical protein
VWFKSLAEQAIMFPDIKDPDRDKKGCFQRCLLGLFFAGYVDIVEIQFVGISRQLKHSQLFFLKRLPSTVTEHDRDD